MTSKEQDTTKYEEMSGLVVFDLIAQLCIAQDAAPLTRYPECWSATFGEWVIAVNGHDEPKHYNGVLVPEFYAYVEFNGWPFAIMSPFGDGIVGAGSYANLSKLETDLRTALAALSSGAEGAAT